MLQAYVNVSTESIPTVSKALAIASEILAQYFYFFLCTKTETESTCTVARV